MQMDETKETGWRMPAVGKRNRTKPAGSPASRVTSPTLARSGWGNYPTRVSLRANQRLPQRPQHLPSDLRV